MTIRSVQIELTLPSGHREAITTRDAVALIKQASELLVGVNIGGTVLERAAEVCGCKPQDIFTNKRPEHIVLARWLVWEHMRDVECVRPYKIATLTGYDHGTVRNAFTCMADLRTNGKPWQKAAIELFWNGIEKGQTHEGQNSHSN